MTDRDEWLRAARDFEAEGQWARAMHVRMDLAAHDPQPILIDSIRVAPWKGGYWLDRPISIGACPTDDFYVHDVDSWEIAKLSRHDLVAIRRRDEVVRRLEVVAVVLGYGDNICEKSSDIEAAGLARLKDGRFIAWESSWTAATHGFGATDIAFARTAGEALAYISARSRELIKWS